MLENLRECLLRWWLLLVPLNCYNNSFAVAQTTIQPLNVRVFAVESAVFECNNADIKTNDHIWKWYKINPTGAHLLWQEYSNITKGRYEVLVDEQREHSRLTIFNTSLEDNQTKYTCECLSSSATAILSIILKKSLDSMYPKCEANITAVSIKTTVKMACRAIGGDPRPSLQWYRNGKILTEQADFVYFSDGNVSYFDELTRELTVDDETAVYTCRAEGPAVKGDQHCSISVATPPTVTIIANTTYFNARESLEFTCMAISLWNITDYIWMFDNQLVTSSKSSTLVLSNLQSEDAGKEIGCKAITSSGLNGNDSVIIYFFNEDQENNALQLIGIVVGGMVVVALVSITVFLIIWQKRKRNRANKTPVPVKHAKLDEPFYQNSTFTLPLEETTPPIFEGNGDDKTYTALNPTSFTTYAELNSTTNN